VLYPNPCHLCCCGFCGSIDGSGSGGSVGGSCPWPSTVMWQGRSGAGGDNGSCAGWLGRGDERGECVC